MNREVRVPPETPYGAAVQVLLSDTSLALVRHLDFRPSCEVTKSVGDCGKDASFSMRCLHCGHVRLYCAEHVAEIRALAKLSKELGCKACQTYRPDLDELVEFVPLGFSL